MGVHGRRSGLGLVFGEQFYTLKRSLHQKGLRDVTLVQS